MKFTKTTYLHGFTIIVLALGLVRLFSPLSNGKTEDKSLHNGSISIDSIAKPENNDAVKEPEKYSNIPADTRTPHRILSVPRYDTAFPDLNDVQLLSAEKWGVKPVTDAADAESRKSELVYVGSSPWFLIDKLKTSAPYLVPRAAILLHDIGRAFYDSLDVKGVPLHKIIVSSVLRTREDIEKLRRYNTNATENSCHLYGTTFDICQNRYKTVEDPNGPKRRQVTNDTLKWVLSEVLRDFREQGRCYVKYERKQGCFHVTTR